MVKWMSNQAVLWTPDIFQLKKTLHEHRDES
jgi:hypothetical protein